MKLLRKTKVKKKCVLVRLDFNNKWRVKAAWPTLRYLLDKKAKKVRVIGHRGRPEGKKRKDLSLRPFRSVLPSGVGLVENLRFDSREKANDISLAKELAEGFDLFVQEAFSVCHREHASIVGLPKVLPSCAGLRLEKEVKNLGAEFKRPIIYIIGGVKVETKLPLARQILEKDKLDHLLLGGVVANEVLFDEDIQLTDTRLHLPVDAVTSMGISAVGDVSGSGLILDIGPDTRSLFKKIIKTGQTIIWNGPLGKFEESRFAWGTRDLIQTLVALDKKIIVGGGETIKAVKHFANLEDIDFISTGGGAMLQFLAKGTLSGIEALENCPCCS